MLKVINVWKVINKWDPVNKLENSEIDEYRDEISKIASIENSEKDSNELAKEIHNVFSKSYDEKFNQSVEECIEIAEQLLKSD